MTVLYSTATERGSHQGIGNHILIFSASYSYCIDNGLVMSVDANDHPVFRNMNLPKIERKSNAYYIITHLTDLRSNDHPFQIHSCDGSNDTNGASFMNYAHNISKIRDALNVPDITIDGCVMHYRRFAGGHERFNLGLPYYMNALKHIDSPNVYIMSGYDNYNIDAEITKKNVQYLIERLSTIYPNKRFIDIQSLAEYKRDDPAEECALHWYLCVKSPEMIAANSTFSLSAAIFRDDRRTVIPNYAQPYKNFNVRDYRKILKDVHFVMRNVIVSAWYDVDSNPKSRAKRTNAISRFFERINNADIIIFTDIPETFKELDVDWLSHVHIIRLPFDSLYGCQFKEFIERCLIINSGMRSRGASWKMVAIWYSKIWMILQASGYIDHLYDKISWIDLGIYKNETIVQREIFPVFEKHMINRSLWYSLNGFHKTLHYLHDGPVEAGFQLYPNVKHVQMAFALFDTILKECVKTNILVGSEEELMRLMLSLTSEFLMIGIDKSIGAHGYCRCMNDFSDSIDDFVHTIYAEVPSKEHPPPIDITYMKQWIAHHNAGYVHWDQNRDVW